MNLRNVGSGIVIPIVVVALFGCKGVDDSGKAVAAAVVASSVNALKSTITQGQTSTEQPSQTPEQKTGQVSGTSKSSAISPFSSVASDHESAELAKGPFAGITITEPDPGAGSYLANSFVVYVSPEGNYASLSPVSGGGAYCFAWVTDPQTDSSLLAFGIQDPSTIELYKRAGINVCPQFTVQFESETTLRVVSGKYNRQRKIVARVPLKMPDWTAEIFARHAIKGVRLGPVSTGVKRAVPFDPRALNGGAFLQFGMVDPTDRSKLGYPRQIFGYAAVREVTGWGSDILTASWLDGKLDQSGQGAIYNKAVLDKYGPPTLISGGGSISGAAFWYYGIEGEKLQTKDASPFNCLGTYYAWQGQLQLRTTNASMGDIGPWGCSLVMRHTYAGDNDVIGSYGVEIASPLAIAMVYFQTRLREVAMAKEKIAKLQQFKPKF